MGDISSRQRFLYDKVLGCNEYVEGLLKAGIRADEADTAARE